MKKNRIAFILPFYGKLPIWFEVFLLSCSYNASITWFIFTDLVYKGELPKNVFLKELSKKNLSNLIYNKTKIKHDLSNPHKLCDFKPLYGVVFEEYLNDYGYWGHCDMDVIFGNIATFLTKINYQNYDIISTRKHAISGHFTLYKNSKQINSFFESVPNYIKAFTNKNYQGFDEGYYSYHLFNELEKGRLTLNIFWPSRNSVDRMELQSKPNGWYWHKGEIKNKSGITGNYLHMIDWKKTILEAPKNISKNTNKLYINKYGIWHKIPNNIRWKILFKTEVRFKIKYKINLLKSFIKYKVLQEKRPEIKANVIEGYKILK